MTGSAITGKRLALGGALLLVIATVLPWAKDPNQSENAFFEQLPWFATGVDETSVPGDDFVAHGPLFVGLAVGAAFLVLASGHRAKRGAISGLGAVAALFVVVDYNEFTSLFDRVSTGADVGIGLYLAGLAAIGIVVAPWLPTWTVKAAAPMPVPQAVAPANPSPPPAVVSPAPPEPPAAEEVPSAPHQAPTAPPAPGSAGKWWND